MIQTFKFSLLEWVETSPGISQKGFECNGHRYRLVKYDVGARHEEWCARDHRGYVLEGAIEFETPAERFQIEAGEAFFISEGSPHRARNAGAVLSLFFLVD